MGQKVHPHGLRVGVIKGWDAKWYADKRTFADNLIEDNKIREFVKKELFSAGISKIEIERSAKRVKLNIYTAKPGVVIGKGGATIRALTEETGTSIDIDDDGTVKIAAVDSSAAKNVMARIEEIVAEVEAGAIYKGKVTRLADFGAFVAIVGNKEGLVHISQIAEERVEKVSDYLQVGQEVTVKVVEIDRQGRIRLTMKDLAPKQETEAESAPAEETSVEQE